MREEVHEPEEHDSVPVEDDFGKDYEYPVAIRGGGGWVGAGRSVRGEGNHHPTMALPE
jgi:hypothetical protein